MAGKQDPHYGEDSGQDPHYGEEGDPGAAEESQVPDESTVARDPRGTARDAAEGGDADGSAKPPGG
jgi:hypothetical protein